MVRKILVPRSFCVNAIARAKARILITINAVSYTHLLIQKKVILSRPYIYRVHTHIKRHIPHDLNATTICRIFHLHPLSIEDILQKHLVCSFFLNLLWKRSSGLRPVFFFPAPFIPDVYKRQSDIVANLSSPNFFLLFPFVNTEYTSHYRLSNQKLITLPIL